MARIVLENVNIDFPVYDGAQRSLKGTLLKMGVGGAIFRRSRSHVVVRALEGLSLTLAPGDRLGLIGHNGAGKSTLLKVLAGLRVPTSGRALIEGRVAALLTLGSIIDSEMTGYENIARAGVLLDLPADRRKSLADEVAEFTELGEYLNLPVKIYSAGMTLRLSFALMTAQQPDILLLDETFSAGDSDFRIKASQRMSELGIGTDIVVMATHSLGEVRQMCSHVLWLEHGRAQMLGPVAEVLAAYERAAPA